MFTNFIKEAKVEAYKKIMNDAILEANTTAELACAMLKVNRIMDTCNNEVLRGKLTLKQYDEIVAEHRRIRDIYKQSIRRTI